MDPTQAALNKVYRAVHDGVCPNCGADLRVHAHARDSHPTSMHSWCSCGFKITTGQMKKMKETVAEWGKGFMDLFNQWQKENP